MPVYCYRTDSGEMIDLVMDVAEHAIKEHDGIINLPDGGIGYRDYVAEQGHRAHVKPYLSVSTSLAVHPEQVQETIEQDRNMGSMADEYRPDGKLVFRSRHKHDAYAKLRGFVNKENFCGT